MGYSRAGFDVTGVDDVFGPGAHYMSGIKGAECTGQLKRKPRLVTQYFPDACHPSRNMREKSRSG